MASVSYSLFILVSVLIAHSLCFRVDLPVSITLEGETNSFIPRQEPDNVLVIQDIVARQASTQAPFPTRIRDTLLGGIRDFGNNVRQVPNRVTECFQNISKCAGTILRRNATTSGTSAGGLTIPLTSLPVSTQDY